MKKKTAILITALSLAAVSAGGLTACGSTASTTETTTVAENTKTYNFNGFNYNIPNGWDETSRGDNNVEYSDGDSSLSIYNIDSTDVFSDSNTVNLFVNSFKSQLTDPVQMGETAMTTISGHDGFTIKFSSKTGGEDGTVAVAAFSTGKKNVFITIATNSKRLDYMTVLNSVSNSFVEYTAPKIKSINATYSGSTEAGTEISDSLSSDIAVTATYDNGSTEAVNGWTIKDSKTLKAGETSTVKITYEGVECDLKVKCTTIKKEDYKKKCKEVAYKTLARDPDKYKGEYIKIYGKVLQVTENGNDLRIRIATSNDGYGNYYEDVFYVEYTRQSNESRILEDDMITFYGTYYGTTTYTSTGGSDITIPALVGAYYDLK